MIPPIDGWFQSGVVSQMPSLVGFMESIAIIPLSYLPQSF